mmetsp:Transcript_69556/g.123962  ORF Transcript_69556/g.123962 Transcript_69556/m.123962 type:complete len:114 (-) Transcript_69556:101-442(-)
MARGPEIAVIAVLALVGSTVLHGCGCDKDGADKCANDFMAGTASTVTDQVERAKKACDATETFTKCTKDKDCCDADMKGESGTFGEHFTKLLSESGLSTNCATLGAPIDNACS